MACSMKTNKTRKCFKKGSCKLRKTSTVKRKYGKKAANRCKAIKALKRFAAKVRAYRRAHPTVSYRAAQKAVAKK